MIFFMMPPETLRTIGIIVAAQGLRGEVRVKPFDTQASWLNELDSVWAFRPDQPPQLCEIEFARKQKNVVVMKFNTLHSRTDAETWRGTELKVEEDWLPELTEDEFYFDELEGMTVISDDSDRELGTVKLMLDSNVGQYMEVTPVNGRETILIPFQEAFIVEVDLDKNRLFVSGLDSMFPGDLI